MTNLTLHEGDNRLSLRRLIDEGVRVHSVVTDPPYGLVSIQKRFGKEGSKAARTQGNDGSFARLSGGFMAQSWDGTGIERDPEFWKLIYDILLPGGYVFAFSGSRTGHWQACAMEMAGFVMHPMHGWVFGCLDTETLAATPDGDKPYTELSVGDEVICYDPDTGEYSVQPILEVVEYDYEDTAYRLVGNHGEQVVSRNHRCIVERDGSEVFHFAEALEQQEIIPVLEDLRGLREALRLQRPQGNQEQGVFEDLQGSSTLAGSRPDSHVAGRTQGPNDRLSCLLDGGLETGRLAAENSGNSVLQSILPGEGRRTEAACPALSQGPGRLDEGQLGLVSLENDRREEPFLEGWGNASQQKGQPRAASDQVCALSAAPNQHVSQGRLCDGTSDRSSEGDGKAAAALGGGASHQPRRDGQQDHQPDAVRDQCRTQTVRAWAGHKTDLVRVVPFQYVGKVWCLRVPTGAFVAVRNGVAFPTGNSGFPKAHNAAKAIDKHLKVEGSFAPEGAPVKRMIPGADQHATGSWEKNNGREYQPGSYVPGSPEAAQWEGWAYGTQAQKPALEPIYLGQKPFSEKTGAANLLKHGVGAVNIDGCRVPADEDHAQNCNRDSVKGIWGQASATASVRAHEAGRHPANLILDGSPEVVAMFPNSSARFFHQFPQNQCCLCEQEVKLCDVNIAGQDSTIQSTQTDDFVLSNAVDLPLPESADKPKALNETAMYAAPCSKQTHQQTNRCAQRNAAGSLEAEIASRVKSAVNLCGSCATVFAQSLVQTSQGKNPESLLSQVFITERKKQILIQSLALIAATPESIATTTTTANLKMWFGFVLRAIEDATNSEFLNPSNVSGGPLRYSSKAGKADRAGSKHPTVKPIALMQYLIRHITPPGGVVLDPFAGSGTTAEAARREGFDCILMEAQPEYIAFLKQRFALADNEIDDLLGDCSTKTTLDPELEDLL